MSDHAIMSSDEITAAEVPLQPSSTLIWDEKHRLKDQNSDPVDQNLFEEDGTFGRVARALAKQEQDPEAWTPKFMWALQNGATPAGRIIANAGAEKYKTNTSTINCTISSDIHDDTDAIGRAVREALVTLKYGSGIGYCFSTLRYKGAPVSGAGAQTGGPLGFMDIFDCSCGVIESAGGRRGAQMATFDVSHPDVQEFIVAKRENGRLRKFNLSLLITEELVEAVKNDEDWPLYFPVGKAHFPMVDSGSIIYRDWPVHNDKYTYDEEGRVACEIVSWVKAGELWSSIMQSTYVYSDPGFLLIDHINRMNNNWFCETISATNPCGEQPLPPNGACLLGSIILAYLVNNPFTKRASFDWDKFREIIRIFTRMLDNVVEINNLPLEAQRREIERKRRHGMGYMGLGSALTLLGIRYGSQEAIDFTSEATKVLAVEGWKEGLELAKEKGAAPIMDEDFVITGKMLRQRPEIKEDGYQVGDKVKGRYLWGKHSRYMQKIATVEPELVEELTNVGCRFTHHTSIAPTGTIAMGIGNNVSNGIEPSFSHSYFRNVIRPGRKTKEQMEVQSFELLTYRHFVATEKDRLVKGYEQTANEIAERLKNDSSLTNPDEIEKLLAEKKACMESANEAVTQIVDSMPETAITAMSLTPEEHIRMQAAAQEWVDSSISKTVNVPTNIPYEDFKDLYMLGYELGLKGCTTFRFNPEVHGSVLVTKEDLASMTCEFSLADGETVTLTGDETVFYDGEEHIAANLYDAFKNNQYAKY